jgi:hypothetical protein
MGILSALFLVGLDVAGIAVTVNSIGFNIESCLIAAVTTAILGGLLIYVKQ